jgi:hypothetical protein
MRDFAAAVARLDAETDNRLGDFLFYDIGGLISDTPVRGTISDPADLSLIGLDAALDNVGTRRRLEINSTIVAKISRDDRIRSTHPLLAGHTWKPSGPPRQTRSGRYWLTDLVKVGS